MCSRQLQVRCFPAVPQTAKSFRCLLKTETVNFLTVNVRIETKMCRFLRSAYMKCMDYCAGHVAQKNNQPIPGLVAISVFG